ncbi:polyprotein of Ty1/Copia retrotransposon [Cycloclasticus sp.]|uniref:Ty1/Copia family ribonuclease HI n=1 Tax=Cycloclasticus sp. TaxID=2024830 RepID=UPI00257CD617|nr:polyprotein of Ty1/Copia retrotransposon [Cycloclasticus sp.]
MTTLKVGGRSYSFEADGGRWQTSGFDINTVADFHQLETAAKFHSITTTKTRKQYKPKKTKIVNGERVPQNLNEFMDHPHRDLWFEAYWGEMDNLANHSVFERCKRDGLKNVKPIRCRLVCDIKTDQHGNTIKRKCRLTARGDLTSYNVHYTEVYAPTVQPEVLRCLLSVGAALGLIRLGCDTKCAFLYGKMERDVYCEYPRFWDQYVAGDRSSQEKPNDPNYVAKLLRSIYGLKDGAHLYYRHFRASMKDIGFTLSSIDNCFWYKGSLAEGTFIAVCSHVDDCTVLASNQKVIDQFRKDIESKYTCTFDENLKFIIGIAVNEDKDGNVTIDQQKYVNSLLERHSFEQRADEPHRTHKTPLPTDAKFTAKLEEGERLLQGAEITLYQSLVGGLLYLHVRCDLSYSIGKLCRYMHAPTTRHLGYARHLLKYLRYNPNYGIKYQKGGDNILRASCDASYLDSPDDGKSTIGYIITLNGGPIAFKSKLSKLVCTSTCYSEYVAMYEVTRQVMLLRRLMAEIGLEQKSPTVIHSDNAAAIEVARATVEPSSHRHINMRYHFIRECWADTIIKFIPTVEQQSDILTKSLPFQTYEKFRTLLMTWIPPVKQHKVDDMAIHNR